MPCHQLVEAPGFTRLKTQHQVGIRIQRTERKIQHARELFLHGTIPSGKLNPDGAKKLRRMEIRLFSSRRNFPD